MPSWIKGTIPIFQRKQTEKEAAGAELEALSVFGVNKSGHLSRLLALSARARKKKNTKSKLAKTLVKVVQEVLVNAGLIPNDTVELPA